MQIITVRNVHEALPKALYLLDKQGVERDSRNGSVLVIPGGLTTVYTHPCERIVFWPERDCNPFFHLYESLWMLDGRNDVKPLVRYAKQMAEYSDDGVTLHGAYGNRWRSWFNMDQIEKITARLKTNPDDRRCVLQMWDTESDLGWEGKAVPCNLVATFQRDTDGRLDMIVFNRSNDLIWGCYGANAVHFSVLQEHMASEIGCPVGSYTQVTANAHAYLKTYEPLKDLPRPFSPKRPLDWSPYNALMGLPRVRVVPMRGITRGDIRSLLSEADSWDTDYKARHEFPHPWYRMAHKVLLAHHIWRTDAAPQRFVAALAVLEHEGDSDWATAASEWIQRRYDKWFQK